MTKDSMQPISKSILDNSAALPNGVFAATLTPLNNDLSIDYQLLADHCHWLLANGCHGIVPMGTTGEANSFSVPERIEMLDRLIAFGVPANRLLVGTGCCAIPDTVALTRHAVAHNTGGALVLPPFYYKNVSDDGVFAAFDQIIQSVADPHLKLYLYHIPQITGVPINPALIARLLKHYPNVIAGIKDSSNDWNNMKALHEQFPSLRVYAGTEKYLLPLTRIGGAGCISATTNITCSLANELYLHRTSHEAETLHQRVIAAREVIEKYPVIPALKRLTAMRTGRVSWLNLRPPHITLSEERAMGLMADLKAAAFPLW